MTMVPDDAVGYIWMLDAALSEIDARLRRMLDLAYFSASGANTAGDRKRADAEFQRLKREIDEISLQAEAAARSLGNC